MPDQSFDVVDHLMALEDALTKADICPSCEGGGVTYTNPEEPGPDEITCETCGGTGATE